MKTNTKSQINPFDKNPIEAIRDAGIDSVKTIGSSIKTDVIQAGAEDFISQLLGIERRKNDKQTSGELKEGEELLLSEVKKVKIEAAIDYRGEILHAETRNRNQDNKEIRIKMDQLLLEISKLSKSSKELQLVTKDLNMEILPQSPGKLHVNFFEWIFIQLQSARIRVENSVNWFNALSGKKNKKDFWSLSKKHGTSFSLSGERVVAQQTG